MSFGPDMEGVECRSLELDPEEHSFFPDYYEVEFDVGNSDSASEKNQTEIVENSMMSLRLTAPCYNFESLSHLKIPTSS